MAEAERALRDPDLVAAVATGIVAARERAGLGRVELAERLGWTRARLVDLELGRREPRLVDLERLAVALGATLDDLLGPSERGRHAATALGL